MGSEVRTRGPRIERLRCRIEHDRFVTDGPDLLMLASFTERLRGVLGREPRDHMTGYWLVPCRSVHGIGLSQSLDLVYLDCGLRVIRAVGGFRPWRLSACPEANSVIEMRAERPRKLAGLATRLTAFIA